jgi:two-component system sensor histidine kinase MprB
MSLRTRLALIFAALATVVAALMGVLGYTATTNQLEREIDQSLLAQRGRPDRDGRGPEEDRVSTLIAPDGQVLESSGVQLPVTEADLEAAAGSQPTVLARTQNVDGTPYRIVTVSPGNGQGALLLARDWSRSASVLRGLAVILTISAVGLALLAAILGWLIATRITSRLVRLTDTAEQVSATGQLDVAVPGAGRDEVGRLAGAFNAMLARLAGSQEQQQRLVQDAGHELRTPLTSLRTNISLLERFDELPADVRARVLADLRGESRELATLVDEVLTLAGGGAEEGDPQAVRVADIVAKVATRARRRTGRVIEVTADESVVEIRPPALERALWNLVDNAAKFDPSEAPIEVIVDAGTIEVRDRGPGVPADEPIFDRFYRPVSSRSLPGSGLGLSIVRDVVTAAGGEVGVSAREGGGAIFRIRLPQA